MVKNVPHGKKMKQEKLLQLAETLSGEERIKAYNLAGRSDLARNYANELLIGEGFNYGRGPQAFDPFEHDNWEVLRTKKEFDEIGISYDAEAVKKGVRNTYCFNLCHPYQEKIRNIDDILREHDIKEKERQEFFSQIRDRARYDTWVDETGDFVFRLEETEYSTLAAHTGTTRKEIVGHYLDNLFRTERDNSGIDTSLFVDGLELKLWQFMLKENVEGDEIVARTIKAVLDYNLKDYTNHRPYMIVNRFSKIPTIRFPKGFVIKVLEDYVESDENNTLDEALKGPPAPIGFTDIETDPMILELRRKSILKEIGQGYSCLEKRVDYAVEHLGLDPKGGKLRDALYQWVQKYKDSTYQSDIEELIQAGKKYDLLSIKEIEELEERVDMLHKIKQ